MNKFFSKICILMFAAIFLFNGTVYPQDKMIYNCKQYMHNWDIPTWSLIEEDYVSPILAIDKNFTNQGASSIKLTVAFPGEEWRAGIVETEGFFDLTLYRAISFDMYLPKNAPNGIEVRTIIVTGEDYQWLEIKDPISIRPGRRTTVTASLKKGNRSWSGMNGTRKMTDEIKSGIRKIAIRIESNDVKYEGPVYIDNIRLVK